MGPQRHDAVVTQRVLISGRLRAVHPPSPPGASIAPGALHAPFLEHHHDHATRSGPAAPSMPATGDLFNPADSESDLSFSLQDFVTEFGDELLDSSTGPIRPFTTVCRAPTASSSSPVSSGSCSPPRPRSSMRPPNCSSIRVSARPSSMARWGRENHRRHRAGGGAQRGRLSPHARPQPAPSGLQMAARDPRNRRRCESLGAQRPGHIAR